MLETWGLREVSPQNSNTTLGTSSLEADDGEAPRPRVGTRGLEPASPEKTTPSPGKKAGRGFDSAKGQFPGQKHRHSSKTPTLNLGGWGVGVKVGESPGEAKLKPHPHSALSPPLGRSPGCQSHHPWGTSHREFPFEQALGSPRQVTGKTAELRGSQADTHAVP